MKKLFLLIMLLSSLGLAMEACSPNDDPENVVTPTPEPVPEPVPEPNPDPTPDPEPQPGNGRYLIVSFSRSGNTRSVATEIRNQLDGTLIEVIPTTSYPPDYDATLSRARQEIDAIDNNGTYPSIQTTVESFDDYNVIFICTPLWYTRMSVPMQSFLHSHSAKLTGKRLALAVTSSSSGISSVVADARRLCSGSTFIGDALWVRASQSGNAHYMVSEWLNTLDLSIHDEDNAPETVKSMALGLSVR